MLEIVLGFFLVALGVWGMYDEYYFVADFMKGGIPLFLMLFGLLATLAGIMPLQKEEENEDV